MVLPKGLGVLLVIYPTTQPLEGSAGNLSRPYPYRAISMGSYQYLPDSISCLSRIMMLIEGLYAYEWSVRKVYLFSEPVVVVRRESSKIVEYRCESLQLVNDCY